MAAHDDGEDDGTPGLVPVVSGQRLARLRKQHAELIAKVRHKRNAIARIRAEAEPIARELRLRAAAVRAEHRQLDERLHAAFDAIEADLRLRRDDRATVRALHHWLQSVGAISRVAQAPIEAPADTAAAAPHQAMRPTFLRLASAYHPDKTTDEERRAVHTEIMKDLNRAYACGDVSRLLELERTLAETGDIADERSPASLESDVTALRAQLRALSQEMRELRASYHGAIVLEFRRLTEAGCPDPIAALTDDARLAAAQTRHILELVAAFRDGHVDLAGLLAGPVDDDDAWLAEVFAAARSRTRGS